MVKKKTKNPPILSHEFVIQNHADILAVVLMAVFGGLLLPATKEFCKRFIEYQYAFVPEDTEGETVRNTFGKSSSQFGRGLLDCLAIFFQTIILIIFQAVIHDYFLEKYSKRFHLSKTKHSRFHDSAHLLIWFVCSSIYSINIIINHNMLADLSSIWTSYPETLMPWEVKAFMIVQISYWLHSYPELYFHKVRKDELFYRIRYYSLHLIFVLFAYILHLWKLSILLISLHYVTEATFHLSRLTDFADKKQLFNFSSNCWTAMFTFTRIITIVSSFYVYFIGFSSIESQGIDIEAGIFNSSSIRLVSFSAIGILQIWLMTSFFNMLVRRRREEEKLRNLQNIALKQNKTKKNSQGGSKKMKSH